MDFTFFILLYLSGLNMMERILNSKHMNCEHIPHVCYSEEAAIQIPSLIFLTCKISFLTKTKHFYSAIEYDCSNIIIVSCKLYLIKYVNVRLSNIVLPGYSNEQILVLHKMNLLNCNEIIYFYKF